MGMPGKCNYVVARPARNAAKGVSAVDNQLLANEDIAAVRYQVFYLIARKRNWIIVREIVVSGIVVGSIAGGEIAHEG
jgi:hypothetical protein